MKIALLAALLSSLAFAAPGAHAFKLECPSLESLREKAQDCNDNEEVAEAGIDCLEKLQDLVKQESAAAAGKMSKSHEKMVGGGANKQTANFAGTVADLGISTATIDELLKVARYVKQVTTAYQKDLVLPDDFEISENLPGGIEEFLKDQPCFTENRETLQWVNEDVDDVISDLETAKKEAQKLSGKTKAAASSLNEANSASTGKTAGGKAAKGSADIKKKPATKSKSTVTGVTKKNEMPAPKK